MTSNFERFQEILKQADSENYSSLCHLEPKKCQMSVIHIWESCSSLWWRFCKILWPSQNIWTLSCTKNLERYLTRIDLGSTTQQTIYSSDGFRRGRFLHDDLASFFFDQIRWQTFIWRQEIWRVFSPHKTGHRHTLVFQLLQTSNKSMII